MADSHRDMQELREFYALVDSLVSALSDASLDLSALLADLAQTGSPGQLIRANRPHATTPRQECAQLIRACERYPGGIRSLHGVLWLHLGQRSCWTEIEPALIALFPEELASRPGPAPRPQQVYLSYAWGDVTPEGQERRKLAEDLCRILKEAGIQILRDIDQVKPGERISTFMQALTKGDVIIVVLSDHYLKSEYCLFELYGLWTESKHDPDLFLRRVIPLTLPDARMPTTEERLARGEYWLKRQRGLEERLDKYGHDAMGPLTYAKYKRIQQFAQHTADILELLMDKHEPRDFERQAQEGFPEVIGQIVALAGG